MKIINCKDCVWFGKLEDYPEAMTFHKKLCELFDSILPKREGKIGVCKRIPMVGKVPRLINENGFCHQAEERENDQKEED